VIASLLYCTSPTPCYTYTLPYVAQDHKTRSIEYSHVTCLWIVQIHCMYVHVMGVFSLFLFFSQVDFAMIRLLADWIVTGYSTVWFIQVSIPGNARLYKKKFKLPYMWHPCARVQKNPLSMVKFGKMQGRGSLAGEKK
jgi:hypothetical protein